MPSRSLKTSGDALTALVAAKLQCALDRGADAAELAAVAIHATLTEAVIVCELQADALSICADQASTLTTSGSYERGRRDGAADCVQSLFGMLFSWWKPGDPSNRHSPFC